MNAKEILNYIDIQIKTFNIIELESEYRNGLLAGLNMVKDWIATMEGDNV